MKYLITIITIVFSSVTFASAKVSYVSVKSDTIYYATATPKTHTIPACATSENSNK